MWERVRVQGDGEVSAIIKIVPKTFSVIVMDVDGTMVGPDFVVSDRLRRSVQSARDAGAIVSLATGRMMRSARRFARDSGTDGPVICYQGALTFSAQTGDILRHERISPDAAADALRLFKSAGAHVNLYLDDEVYVEKVTAWAEGYSSRMELQLNVVPSLLDMAGRGPTLILAVDEKERTEQLVLGATRLLGERARVTHSLSHFCEVGSANAGKERALDHLADFLGIPSERFIAFGDGKGDAGMLEWAGLGVAMKDSHPDTLAVADRVAPGPDEYGVAQVIEELLQQGRIGR